MLIENLLTNLSWNSDLIDQLDAIRILTDRDDYDLHLLIQPLNKTCWENAAKVLKNKGVEKTKVILDDLFIVLQDMNWPGSVTVRELLQEYPKNLFLPAYQKALSNAIANNDEQWFANMSIFVGSGKVQESDIANKELYRQLYKEYIDMWVNP